MNTNESAQHLKKSAVSGFTIERTAKRMKQRFKRMLKEHQVDVTVDQWVILQLLDREDGLSQFQIAHEAYKDAPTVTRIIDLLCKKGLTKRAADATDRRKFNIFLTAKGNEKVAEIKPIVKAFRKIGWNGLDDDAINQMMDTLDRIYHNLS